MYVQKIINVQTIVCRALYIVHGTSTEVHRTLKYTSNILIYILIFTSCILRLNDIQFYLYTVCKLLQDISCTITEVLFKLYNG